MDRLEKKQFVNLSAVQGLLYGFPPYAVEFFCHAHTTGQPIGIGRDRKEITIPTHHARSEFVYVIPLQNEPAPEDRAIQRQAAEILAEYRERRPRYLQPDGRLDAIRLINDWYRDGADGKTPIRFDAARQDPETSRRGSRPAAALGRTASVQIDPSGGVGPHGGNRTIAEYHVQAEAGNALAQFRLGGIYTHGMGVPADLVQAAHYYRLAAERGMVRAQVFLALAYLHGRGVAQDPNEGLKWLRQAAEKGDSGAYYYLGQLHDQGTVVPRDATVAADWYRLAAADTKDTMTVMPQFNLGRMYAAGDGVPTDLPQAARWYRIAAERGYRAAQRALGTMYLDGVGVPRDAAEGLAWIMVAGEGSGNQAARQGQKELENGQPPAVVARAQQRSRELAAEVQRNRRGSPSPPDP
jgi:TPR repeat protein